MIIESQCMMFAISVRHDGYKSWAAKLFEMKPLTSLQKQVLNHNGHSTETFRIEIYKNDQPIHLSYSVVVLKCIKMSARSPMKWREAATLILVAKKEMARCHFDYRILMLERSSKSKFMVCKSYEYDVIHLYMRA